jgi:hypothetical protein
MDKLGSILGGTRTLRAPGAVRPPAIARSVWEMAVGPRIAARTQPVRLERGVLLVRVATAAWASELTMLGESIVARLRARGVVLESVRFTVGKISPPVARPAKPPVVVAPPNAPLPESLQPLVAKIEEPELRAAVTRAAAQSIALAAAAPEGEVPRQRRRRRGSGSSPQQAPESER